MPDRRTEWEFSALTEYAIEFSDVWGRAPRSCFVNTAHGDNPAGLHGVCAAAQVCGIAPSHLAFFAMPNVDDITPLLLEQDVISVFAGIRSRAAGDVAPARRRHRAARGLAARCGADRRFGRLALLACRRRHGLVRSRVAAGHRWARPGALRKSVHYDSEPRPRTLLQRLISDGTQPAGYATDNGLGVLHRGTDIVQALSERDDATSGGTGTGACNGGDGYSPAEWV